MSTIYGKKISELSWESRFVERLPGDSEKSNFVRQVRGISFSEVPPTPVRAPKLFGWSERLGFELALERPSDPADPESLEILAGNRVAAGMRPYAARYGGHQFGNWAGQLGDGRAITLGEISVAAGVAGPERERFELQLKGAGPTPYSRRADGRAVLRSSVREFLCSEAMHFLGVPTTRALSLVSTGEPVVRDMFYDGNPKAEPGAIVCRVAPSFLRFGNFEILAASGENELLKKLADLLIADHYPDLSSDDPDVYGKLFDKISGRTARMIAEWMRVGFVHGVMNTDNMSVLGLTIDYGPYGWLEPYDPGWTPNTTDAEGRRYRFGNQPSIALWNLARLGEALLSLIGSEERVLKGLTVYREVFSQASQEIVCRKLGLPGIESEADQALVHDVFDLLAAAETDFTIFFRRLSNWEVQGPGGTPPFLELVSGAFYSVSSHSAELSARWLDWSRRYAARVGTSGLSDSARIASMKRANPKYVLRNYLAQSAITALEAGDTSMLERLLRVLESPYDEQPAEEELAAKRPEWARSAPGCSALSCSS